MNDADSTFDDALLLLVDYYHKLSDASCLGNGTHLSLVEDVHRAISVVFETLLRNPDNLESMREEAITVYFELRVVELLLAGEEKQSAILKSLEDELRSILCVDSPKARKAGGQLVSCLLLALDELPSVSDHILALLSSLTDRHEGIKPSTTTSPPFKLSPDIVLDLSMLLDYGLFGEVSTFLGGLPPLQQAYTLPGLGDLAASLISIASRKGGVGKSTVTLATALTAMKRRADCRVCIVDLDITGPVWQYLLCPDGRTTNGKPLPYLNRLIDVHQPDTAFCFGDPTAQEVLDCVAETRMPSFEQPVGLITFADLPRTNRFLVQAIANNRLSFNEFMAAVLRAVSSRYDFIILDNSPGFDPLPLTTLAIAGIVPHGLPLVMSTEQGPDLRGTFLELTDFRLMPSNRPPMWIVNKASKEAEEFFSKALTVVEIAGLMRGYAEIMPDAPVLNRVIQKNRTPYRIASPLPFDGDFARPNFSSIDSAKPLSEDGIKKFLDSKLFKRFDRDIAPRLPNITEMRPKQ